MENEITIEDMVEQLGGPMTPAEDTPPAEEPPAETPPAEETPAEETPATDPPAQPAQEQPQLDKSQQAFIYMRQQNKKYADMIKGVAEVLGINPNASTNEEQLLNAVQQSVIAKQAESKNIPAAVLQEMQQLRTSNEALTQKQREQQAAIGFQNLKTKYDLDQAALNKFAQELVTSGINPLAADVNLEKEYRTLHFEDLMNSAVAKAVAAEQARAAAAANQSTTPSTTQGADKKEPVGAVKSVQALDEWLKANVK